MKNLHIVKKILFYILCVFWTVTAFFASVFLIERNVFYPLSDYKNEIYAAAEHYGIDKALLFSIIRTESGFKKNAVSDKGATGLMQITENTAEYVAKMKGVSTYNLKDPITNIDFGCHYYKYLEKRFCELNTVLAAYNAGEGNVSIWLKDKKYSADGKNLEIIPLKETDEYVKKINKSLVKYKKLYANILDK